MQENIGLIGGIAGTIIVLSIIAIAVFFFYSLSLYMASAMILNGGVPKDKNLLGHSFLLH